MVFWYKMLRLAPIGNRLLNSLSLLKPQKQLTTHGLINLALSFGKKLTNIKCFIRYQYQKRDPRFY